MELFQSNFACLHVCLAFALFRYCGLHFQVFGKSWESEIFELYLTVTSPGKKNGIASDLRINPPAQLVTQRGLDDNLCNDTLVEQNLPWFSNFSNSSSWRSHHFLPVIPKNTEFQYSEPIVVSVTICTLHWKKPLKTPGHGHCFAPWICKLNFKAIPKHLIFPYFPHWKKHRSPLELCTFAQLEVEDGHFPMPKVGCFFGTMVGGFLLCFMKVLCKTGRFLWFFHMEVAIYLPFSSASFVCFDNEDHKYITIWIHLGEILCTSSSHLKS